MTNPNESPFTPAVHDDQRSSEIIGLPQEQQTGLRGKLIESILQIVFQAITGTFFPGLGTAFEQIQNWFQNLLPEFIREPLEQLVELLVVVLDSIPIIGPPVADAVEALADLFGLMRDTTAEAQSSANVANVGVTSLSAQLASIIAPPGGVYVNDNFDRSAGNLGANWVWEYWGPGAGHLSTDGNNAHWNANGATTLGIFAHHITPTSTDNQLSSLVADGPGDASNEDPRHILILRADTTFDNFIVASIWHNTVEIGIVVAGVYTRLGAVESYTSPGPGLRWAFHAGTTASTRQFLLYLNDSLVCDRTDTGGTSVIGASNRFVGFGGEAGVQFFGFFFAQAAFPDIQGWAGADRAA